MADLYRKQGERDKALALCQKGLRARPESAKGHIALARVLLDMNKWEPAVSALEKATDLSPENIFAYELLGQAWLQLKNPEKTLQAYKMVLFLDPENKPAKNIITKLEPVTAVHYDKTGFAFKSLNEVARHIAPPFSSHPDDPPVLHPANRVPALKEKEQFLTRSAMIEALIYRGELKKSARFLREMKNIYTHSKWEPALQALQNKLSMSDKVSSQAPEDTSQRTITQPRQAQQSRQKQAKILILRGLLARIEHFQSQPQ